jgi:1,2-diacylglycerol-3-alpha-glucose alpha-1,2-galactosyltransferase
MIKVNMYSKADSVAGQGVGSAYLELLRLLKERNTDTLDITVNKFIKADISHYHTINFQYFLSTFFKKRVGKRIGYVHFLPQTLDGSIQLPKFAFEIFKKYVLAFYKRMDHLVVVNPDFKLKLIDLGIPKDQVTFIPNFVAKAQFYEETPEEKLTTRKKYGFTKDDFVILGAGQIQERKGVADFVKLAQENPEVKFIWAGGFSFGKITTGYENFKKMVENPPENLLFPGIVSRDEMRSLNNMADIFLLPSFDELMPMAILEAASCHTSIMLRDLTLYHGIFKDKYIACDDFEQMNEAIKKYAKNKALLQEFLVKADEIANEYSEENLSNIWNNFYQEQAQNFKLAQESR